MTATKRTAYTEAEVEELVEHEQGSSFMLGIHSGWDEASGWLRQKAGEAFKDGHDKEATTLRNLADEAAKIAQERRDRYDEREREYEGRHE
jgi:hypothetical protein